MEGRKTYAHDKGYILNTIYDIIELQKGDLILSDARHGKVYYKLGMYGYAWELIYTITERDRFSSDVSLRIIGDRQDKAREIRRELALLDSMLSGGAEVQLISDG